MEKKAREQIAIHTSLATIIINVALTIFKLLAGILSGSGAMISDAVHTASDVFSTIVVIIGVKMANRDSDKDHPYGHERMECVAAIILAAILFATGVGIGYVGIKNIFSKAQGSAVVPGVLALVAAVVSIVVKEGMYWYTRAAAKKTQSGALMADAWHHRSDALSSIGSFAGILGARLGFPVLDPIASVIICIFILKAAVDIFMDAINKMTDTACDDKTIADIRDVIMRQNGVLGIDQLKTRLFGDKIYVDVEIRADGEETLNKTHEIAQKTHDAIEAGFPNVKHCMVHVNPQPPSQVETE